MRPERLNGPPPSSSCPRRKTWEKQHRGCLALAMSTLNINLSPHHRCTCLCPPPQTTIRRSGTEDAVLHARLPADSTGRGVMQKKRRKKCRKNERQDTRAQRNDTRSRHAQLETTAAHQLGTSHSGAFPGCAQTLTAPKLLAEKLGAVHDWMYEVPRASTAGNGHPFQAFVVRHNGGVSPTGGHPLRACKRCHVDDDRWAEVACSVGNSVAEDETTLRIGVVNLHLLDNRNASTVCVHQVTGTAVQQTLEMAPRNSSQGAKDVKVMGSSVSPSCVQWGGGVYPPLRVDSENHPTSANAAVTT